MMPTFPDYIFVPDDALQRVNIPNILRSEMEIGPQKTRPIQSIPLFQIAMGVRICENKLLDFRTWFRNDIKSGASWFTMKDPYDGTTRRFRFVNYDINWTKNGDVLVSQFILEGYDELQPGI